MAVFNSKIAKQFGIPSVCSFCGGEAQSYWHDGDNVRTCRKCAIEVLPSLMADAVVLDKRYPALERSAALFFEQARANFWQACFKALLRAKNEKLD